MDVERVLSDVPNNVAFWFNNGNVVKNIYELAAEIAQVDLYHFTYHCNADRDDFASWIGGVLGDISLAEKLRSIKDKEKYVKTIRERIKNLEKKRYFTSTIKTFFRMWIQWVQKNNILTRISVFIIFVLLIFVAYIQYSSVDKISILNNKLIYLEQKDACFNTYFNQKIDGTENILSQYNFSLPNLECTQNYSFFSNKFNQENTNERINRAKFTFLNDKVILNINNASWAIFADTSSMLPVINHNTKAIEISPLTVDEIMLGDIISYKFENIFIVHRVVDMGEDDDGKYFITKGDNNPVVDPIKVRFEQIRGIVVALVY